MRISDWSSDVCSSDLFLRSGTVAVRLVRRSRAASLPEIEQRDAELAGLVGEVVLDARARKHDDADRQHVQHLIVALERRGLGVLRPVGLEGDMRHLAGVGPFCGYQFGTLRVFAMQQDR